MTVPWWNDPLRELFAGRDVILAGAIPAAWNDHVRHLATAGARRFLVVATEGPGIGPGPDVPTVVVEPPEGLATMERLRHSNATIASPPDHVRAAIDEFDPDRSAIVIGSFLNESPEMYGRPLLAHRRAEWVALEDKTVVDALWARAGVAHQPSAVVPLTGAAEAAAGLDRGHGTVWAGDAREGYHGGGTLTRWVHDAATQAGALTDLRQHCDTVRVMPFVEGIPCSIHALVLPDGNAVLRPVEMVTLRHAGGFLYAGCATFWDPPTHIRAEMRAVARRVAAQLRREVDFRGTFTIDGVAAADGFWPTELNPRFGAGINTITRAVGDIPILLLHDLAVAGRPVGIDAAGLERTLIDAADATRGGGTWLIGRPTTPLEPTDVVFDGTDWRRAAHDEPADGVVIAGPHFARCTFDPQRTPVGPSVGHRAATMWNSFGRELSTGLGQVTAAGDPFRNATELTIRPERGDDPDEAAAIGDVVAAAFGSPAEARLVAAIRATERYLPDASLVAERSGEIVGHVMLSGTDLVDPDTGATHQIVMLSPLAVAPAHQRTGVGAALVHAALDAAEQTGEPMVVLEGSPAYYGRLGFEWSVPHGITIDLPDWAPPTAAQVHRLSGYDPAVRGHVVYPPAFAEVTHD